jgi:hypothetical protein
MDRLKYLGISNDRPLFMSKTGKGKGSSLKDEVKEQGGTNSKPLFFIVADD